MSSNDLHCYLDFSEKDRVFIVTDVHGEYELLKEELAKVHFNTDKDILIIGGDLADRGPDSEAALEWIKFPWVYRSLGNHEVAVRMYLNGEWSQYDIEVGFGGAWYTSKPRKDVETIASIFCDAPLVLTITTPKGRRIGVAHADCYRDWDRYINLLDRLDVYDLTLWSRHTIKPLLENAENKQPNDPESVRVTGIDHVFHGHTHLGEVYTLANRSWIDTGACFGGKLSVINIDDFLDKQKEHFSD